MVIRFNCFGYVVAIGFWRRGVPACRGIEGINVTKGERWEAPGKQEKWIPWGSGLWVDEKGRLRRGRCEAWEGRRKMGRGDWGMWEPGTVKGGKYARDQQGDAGRERRWPDDHLFQLAQTVITELRPHIWAAGIQKQGKRDLLLSLLRLLKSYTALTVLRAYPFRVAINNFIEMETASRCSIHLNNEELLALWREVR
jgi:hypothetical protein